MQSLTLASKFSLVNPYPVLFFIFFLFVGGCGFQLNRQQVNLPAQARSIAVIQVQNDSFTPRLSLIFKELLAEKFASKGIVVREPEIADLALHFLIQGTNLTRSESTLVSKQNQVVVNYEFAFGVNGKLKIVDQRDQSLILRMFLCEGAICLRVFQKIST